MLAESDTPHRIAAVAGGGLALGTVVVLIIAAARVMITPRPSIRDLSERELRGRHHRMGGLAIVDSNQDELVRSLLALRSFLFDGRRSVSGRSPVPPSRQDQRVVPVLINTAARAAGDVAPGVADIGAQTSRTKPGVTI